MKDADASAGRDVVAANGLIVIAAYDLSVGCQYEAEKVMPISS